jgi:hypothetical protein
MAEKVESVGKKKGKKERQSERNASLPRPNCHRFYDFITKVHATHLQLKVPTA